ncbi:MAG: PHP domain-containing protein [Clostridiales bacterium]|nr:PHP domain-containing protein [Clostridiales bacterium]
MQKDLFGKTRYKINLHTHTTISDGRKDPKEVCKIYKNKGYDAIAITDHWKYGEQYNADNGLLVLSGIEYNILNVMPKDGLFHIVGIGMDTNPNLPKTASAQDAIDAINANGGMPIIAHTAWSLNTPQHVMSLKNVYVTEIYNSVSGLHMSRRPDSSLIVDMLGAMGKFYNLIATDDAHYYDGDECKSFIMVEADSLTKDDIIKAILNGKFYASQGPEVHAYKEGDEIIVKCSPCSEIVFLSDWVWSERVFEGENLQEARYKITPNETYVRVQVKDKDGNLAWTNCIQLK